MGSQCESEIQSWGYDDDRPCNYPETPRPFGRSAVERLCDDIKEGKMKYSAFNAFPRKTYDGLMFDWKPLVSKEDQEFAKYASEITEQIVMAFGMTPAELGITEQTADQRRKKHVNDVIELYEPTSNTKENPMSISNSTNSVTDLANRARELAKEGKTNLDSVKTAIDNGEAEYKERITGNLKGVVNLAKLSGPKSRRFVVGCWKDNEAFTLEGIDFAYGQVIKEDDVYDEYRVYVENGDDWVSDEYYTMATFKKAMDTKGIPYVIEYFD